MTWLAPYTPTPSYTAPQTWTYCCAEGPYAGKTLTYQSYTPMDGQAKNACSGFTVTNGACGPLHDYNFCCWTDQPNAWTYHTTLDLPAARAFEAGICGSRGGKLTDGVCSAATQPTQPYPFCCIPAYGSNASIYAFTVNASSKDAATTLAKSRCKTTGAPAAGACPAAQVTCGTANVWQCCEQTCTSIGTCDAAHESVATASYDNTCAWSDGECDPSCRPNILQ